MKQIINERVEKSAYKHKTAGTREVALQQRTMKMNVYFI